MTQHVVVLGAGFGGLELVTGLSEAIPDKVRITLIDKSDAFMFGFSKLDVMFGRRQESEVWNPYRAIDKPGVEFRQETVTAIDPEHRRVVTDVATYDADILVVALGADYDVAATPGLAESIDASAIEIRLPLQRIRSQTFRLEDAGGFRINDRYGWQIRHYQS